MDRKDTGETTAPFSLIQEDQISQPSDVFDFEKSSGSCLFKLAPSGNTLIFRPIPFAPPTLSLTLLLKATEFLSLICLRILLFRIDLWHSSLKILLMRPFQS